MFCEEMIYGNVPKWIIKRTRENYDVYNMCLSDSFAEAVRNYPKLKKDSELYKAWYYDDFRRFIPSVYRPETLDFCKYPLNYTI